LLGELDHLAALDREFERQEEDIHEIAACLDQFSFMWKQVAHSASGIFSY
jgi:hypothetical protein